jgi:hypothetical protein
MDSAQGRQLTAFGSRRWAIADASMRLATPSLRSRWVTWKLAGLLADVELVGDLPVGASGAEQSEDLALASGDPERAQRGLGCGRLGRVGEVEASSLGEEPNLVG